jgi:hypothetical protein
VSTDEIEAPKGLLAMPRAWDDLEWLGLRRLLLAAPSGVSYATIARTWGRIRQERSRLALAVMEQGDSGAGFRPIAKRPRCVRCNGHLPGRRIRDGQNTHDPCQEAMETTER